MPELTDNESVHSTPGDRIAMSKEATDLRKDGQFNKALPLYRELSKDDSDPYSAAGLLHCLRKLALFDEALRLCTPTNEKHMALDWYRNEIIWTLIQAKLNKLDEKSPVEEVVSVAEAIFALQPRDIFTKWRVVHRVLKVAKSKSRWDIVLKWTELINSDELSIEPIKDDQGRDGWCDKALWYNYRIRCLIETGDVKQAVLIAQTASHQFPRQAKFFKRLDGLANLRAGKFTEAEKLYSELCRGGRADWWILYEYAQALRRLGKSENALTTMCEAAQANKKLSSLISVFAEIGILCREMGRKEDARIHLVLCKCLREENGWSIPQNISLALAEIEKELGNGAGSIDTKAALLQCQQFWTRTVGAKHDLHEPSLKTRGVRKFLQGKLIMGQPDKPFCFIHDTKESYFCLKGDLPKGVMDGSSLLFDAVPSFDKKKGRESWKAVNVRRTDA
jgi:tetratricopeptide (TPR) repeat protein